MKIERIKLTDLRPDEQNARKHDQANLKAIAGSLDQFGQRKPIVITQDNRVVAGNGTLTAAKLLDWKEIDCVRVPADWTADQIKAYALADNRTAELAEWDEQVMASQLLELQEAGFDIEEFGFELVNPPIEDESEAGDEIPEVIEPRTKLGQIWQLGRHRLACGDATDISSVGKLMSGEIADLVFTDPPYGVEYQSNFRTATQKFDVIKNDDVLLDIAPVIKQFNKGFIFVWTSWKVLTKWIDRLSDFGYPSNIIVWNKGGGYIGDLEKTFGSDYEIALVWHNSNKLTGKRIGSVWDVQKDSGFEYAHPTQKPIQLAVTAIESTTKPNAKVLDLFGGSGSTLIAAEKTNRTCFMMEIDPKYCDVIIQRWENLTGQKAELVNASR